MADYTPLFKPGDAVTHTASADVTGGRVVEITGNRQVAAAGADSAKVVGVAGFDAQSGESVTVFSGGVQRPIAAGAITAGARVATGAGGTVSATGTNKIGTALAAAADGAAVPIQFDR
ncbi:capsid cement protein [Georgenia wangjunii]|uniref:capsid cement protein n=1 Tax=Georgenia wangjunii TaxID=3117730 RepID=UPI002F269E9B